jgi:lysophospholipase L1-like esterase
MRGSSGTIFTKMDGELLGASLHAMNAKLIIMEYGGNLVPSVNQSNLDWVERLLEKQIKTIHEIAPDADILFIGPADMSKKINGSWTSFPSLTMTIEKIREIALRNGCAYWDMYRVMGSHNAMVSWVKQNLGGPDYIHFTRAGAARIGELLYNAIKLHYDYYLFRVSHGIDSGKLNEIHAFADSSKNEFDTLVTQNDTLVLTPIENAPEDDDFGSVTEESEEKE